MRQSAVDWPFEHASMLITLADAAFPATNTCKGCGEAKDRVLASQEAAESVHLRQESPESWTTARDRAEDWKV